MTIKMVALAAAMAAVSGAALASQPAPQLPHCTASYGTVAIADPPNATDWWRDEHLEDPAQLLKVYVAQSGCFNVVSRGAGFQAAEQERALNQSGQLQQNSGLHDHQIMAAKYVLVPGIVTQNHDAGGTHIGAALGGFMSHFGSVGSVGLHKKSADVTLTLTDVQTTEEIASTEGKASHSDLGFSAAGGGFGSMFAGAGISSYSNTEIGQVVAAAYLRAYDQLVYQAGSRIASANAP